LEIGLVRRDVQVTAVAGVCVTDVCVIDVDVTTVVADVCVDVVVGHVPHVPRHCAATKGALQSERNAAQSSGSTTPAHRKRVVVVVDDAVVVEDDVVVVAVEVVEVPVVVVLEMVDDVVVAVVVVLVRQIPHTYGHESLTNEREHVAAALSHPSESPPEQTGNGLVAVAVLLIVVRVVAVVVVDVVVVVVLIVVVDGTESAGTCTPPPHAQHAVDAVCPKFANCGSIPSRAHC
jgi:hypothetical protein